MQPVAINEMKPRSEIIRLDHYEPLHECLSVLLTSLDEQAQTVLEQKQFIDHLVQKKIIFGSTYSSQNYSTYRTLYYFLEFTFFEDIEDNFGYRKNDVGIQIGIDYFVDDSFRISRHIQSDYEEVAYPTGDNIRSLSKSLFEEFDKMKSDFIKVLGVFINNSSDMK